MGVDVLIIGPLPTPGVAYVTRSLRADAGIVISASHNPYEDNGIKFFRHDGYKLDDKVEQQIEHLVFAAKSKQSAPPPKPSARRVRIDDALGRYVEFAKSCFPRGMTLEGMRVVVDCANGAAYKSTPCVLRELGAEVHGRAQRAGRHEHQRGLRQHSSGGDSTAVKETGATRHRARWRRRPRFCCATKTARLIDGDDIMAIAGLDLARAPNARRKNRGQPP